MFNVFYLLCLVYDLPVGVVFVCGWIVVSVLLCVCVFVRLGSVGLLLFVWFVYFGIVVCLRTCAAVGRGLVIVAI